MFTYTPLLHLLVHHNMTKLELRNKTNMSTATLAKISKNQYVSMETLNNICQALDCRIEDIVKYVPDEN